MSIGQETGRRLGGRLRMNAAQLTIAAALAIMFLALVLAAAAVKAAPLQAPLPQGPSAAGSTSPILLLQAPDGAPAELAPEEAGMAVRIDPARARVTVLHRFRVAPGEARSGVYLLQLPAGAVPHRLVLSVGDRRLDLALATEGGEAEPELLALPLAGIRPETQIVVQLTYDRAVEIGEGRFVLALPLPAVGDAKPRWTGAAYAGGGQALTVDLDPGLPISELRSPSHGIDIRKGPGERRRIVLADSEPAGGRDFVLVWKPADPKASIGALRRYAAARTAGQEPKGEDTLVLRARLIGRAIAFVPAAGQATAPGGAPIVDVSKLTLITAQTGMPGTRPGPSVSPALAVITLVIWGLGALYLATRRFAGGIAPSFNPNIGPRK